MFIGRPIIWGLSVAGEAGAQRVLSILREELVTVMQLSGTPTLGDITRDHVVVTETSDIQRNLLKEVASLNLTSSLLGFGITTMLILQLMQYMPRTATSQMDSL